MVMSGALDSWTGPNFKIYEDKIYLIYVVKI